MLCDTIRIEIETWKNKKLINEAEYFFLLASLLVAIDKCANTTSVYGSFLKELKKSALKKMEMKPLEIIPSKEKHYTYNQDANILVKKIQCDVLYLDPPYKKRQYCDNYNLLETIAKYDNPTITGKTGLPEGRIKSLYCRKNEIKTTFQDLILNCKTKLIILSYNNEGLLSIQDIKETLEQKGEYQLFQQEYKKYNSNNKNINSQTTEFLHVCIVNK